jgi:hypothetical protein
MTTRVCRATWCCVWLLLPALATPAWADEAALRRCRDLAPPDQRLACYDAIALPASGHAVPAALAAARATPTPSPAVTAAPADQFGLEARAPVLQVQTIISRISGTFDGWVGQTRFKLSNGQEWAISDGSQAAYSERSDPEVTITRGVGGSFFMAIEGVAQMPRVRRLR